MSLPTYIDTEVLPTFPARIVGAGGFGVDTANGVATVHPAYDTVPLATDADPNTLESLVLDTSDGKYKRVREGDMGVVTGENLGLGAGIYAQTDGSNLQFKTLLAEGGGTLTQTGETVTIHFPNADVTPDTPNLIINSGFTFNQRGYAWGTALAVGAFGPDRWKAGSGGGTMTFAATSGPVNVATIAAGTFVQVVAGEDIEGGAYTLSWTGSAPGRINGGLYLPSPIVVTGVAVGSNLTVEFAAGTLSKVRLEAGSAATKYNARQTGVELALCLRFFFKNDIFSWFQGNSGNSTIAVGFATFPVPMRTIPTVTITGGVAYISNTNSNTAVGVVAVPSRISLTGFSSISLPSSFPSTAYQYGVLFTASAEL